MARELDAATIAAIRAAAPAVKNGTFTISHPQRGHFTVKLFTGAHGDFAGKRMLALLTGPSNETDFKTVAFWDDAKKIVRIWTRFRGPDSRMQVDGFNWQPMGWSIYEQKLSIWCDLAVRGEQGHFHQEGYELLLEARCCVCNRKLTHPESIAAGIGPECAGRKSC